MKFYMFTCFLIVVTAEEFFVMLYDNSNDYEMQESIEDSKYARLLTDCDDGEFNKNVNIPSKLKLQNMNPSKLSFGKYAAQTRPDYQNYMQNRKPYADVWWQQYDDNRPSYPKTPLGQLPSPRKKRRQWVIQNPHGYNPIHHLKNNYYNGNLQIKDRSPYYNNKNINSNYYNQYNNIQNNNNINYSKNGHNKNYYYYKSKSKNKYKSNSHHNNKQNNNKTTGAYNKIVNCNNGHCTICINDQCKECNTENGKCEICDGRSCSSVSL